MLRLQVCSTTPISTPDNHSALGKTANNWGGHGHRARVKSKARMSRSGAWLRPVRKLNTETQPQHRRICHTQCFILTDIPGFKKKKNCGTVQHLITLTGSKTPTREFWAFGETLESLQPSTERSWTSNLLRKISPRGEGWVLKVEVLDLEQLGSWR